MRSHLARSSGLLFCAALALLMPACQNGGNWTILGYRLGPLARPDVHTVRVNVFENRTYYRNVEFDLTRALVQQIESTTQYKVVTGCQTADTEITGKILTINKNVLTVNGVNEQRDIETNMLVEFSWKDLRTGEYLSKPTRRPGDVVPEAPVPPGSLTGPRPFDSMPGAPSTAVIGPPTGPTPATSGPANTLQVTATTHYIPEVGQSLATAMQDNIKRMARNIVDLMDNPW